MTILQYVSKETLTKTLNLSCDRQQQAALLANMARINTLYMIKRAGSGHIGTSFSCLDILSWLYLTELRGAGGALTDDIFFSSKGHDAPGLYAVLTACGILNFDLIHQLRRLDGLPGHPDVALPGIVTNTGSLGMGISKAKGMVHANRLNGTHPNVFVLTGDGELQEGQIWESLISAANENLHEITVIVDHNKIQSDTWLRSVSDLGDLSAKFSAFGWQVYCCDGHDLADFSLQLNSAKTDHEPSVIIADTIKGKGASLMESTKLASDGLYAYHSGAPSDEDYQAALNDLVEKVQQQAREVNFGVIEFLSVVNKSNAVSTSDLPHRLIKSYERTLCEVAAKDDRIVVLDGDLLVDCGLLSFSKQFPERFIECGIAEQDMVSQAGGLALKGKLPIVHSFACFLTPRANEHIYNNATEHTQIIYVGSLAGLLPAGPGHSHQSVRDIAILASTPGLVLFEPSCEQEVAMALRYAVSQKNSFYLRLISIPCHISYELPSDYQLQEGVGVTLREGNDAVILSYGPVMLEQVMQAADILQAQHDVNLQVINLPWLNRVDQKWLLQQASKHQHIFILDNHLVSGGLGEQIAAKLAQCEEVNSRVNLLGLHDIPMCGAHSEVLKHHQLDALSIAHTISKNIEVAIAQS